MLQSGELISAHRDELLDLKGDAACFRVPAERVKKRRVIEQLLSELAVEIREALEGDEQQFVFESPVSKGQPVHRTALATALRGTKRARRPRARPRPRRRGCDALASRSVSGNAISTASRRTPSPGCACAASGQARWAASNVDLMRKFAKELVDLQPDGILANSTPATAALQHQTQSYLRS
jgi:hypothetical protein